MPLVSFQFRELIEGVRASRVTREEGSGRIVIEGVKLLGNRSANRNGDGTHNVYPLEARRNAAELYEGAKVFMDHPPRDKPGMERSYADQLARVRNVEAREDGTFGDLHMNPMHPLAESIAWDAQYSPDSLGLSHNAQGVGSVKGEDTVISQITRVRSVDLVCAGATTDTLFESRREAPMKTAKAQLIEALEASSNLLEMIDEEALVALLTDTELPEADRIMAALRLVTAKHEEPEAPEGDGEAPAPMEGDYDKEKDEMEGRKDSTIADLRRQVEALELREAERERHARRDVLLRESRLPQRALTELFVGDVREAKTEERAKALIEERKRLLFDQRGGMGGGSAPAPSSKTTPKSVDDFMSNL